MVQTNVIFAVHINFIHIRLQLNYILETKKLQEVYFYALCTTKLSAPETNTPSDNVMKSISN